VSGSTSTNTGTSPARTSDDTSVEKVRTEVSTSAPFGRPSSSTARNNAEDPEFTAMPWRLANSAATCCSNSRTRRPMRNAPGPLRSTSTTASISASSCTLPA